MNNLGFFDFITWPVPIELYKLDSFTFQKYLEPYLKVKKTFKKVLE